MPSVEGPGPAAPSECIPPATSLKQPRRLATAIHAGRCMECLPRMGALPAEADADCRRLPCGHWLLVGDIATLHGSWPPLQLLGLQIRGLRERL